jgi:choline monooxygenase
MPRFEIDADIRRARTLRSDFYTDPQVFEDSRRRIFERSWQLAGTVGDVDNVLPITLLEGCLDEPALLVKDGEKTRCLSNVCTHRGKIVVEEPCRASVLRCGYHGRRFGLDGKFLSMPEFEDVYDFPSEADNLRELASAKWGQFVFASLDPFASLTDIVGGLDELVDIEAYSGARFTGERIYPVEAHWALYCENYLEGFHIPFVHKTLNAAIDYGSYATHTFRYASLQIAHNDAGAIAARYLFVFPNTMFNFYPWGISVNVVEPLGPFRSRVRFLTYISDESKVETGAGAGLDRVEMEDEAVVESVQKGIRSRFYSHGRYSPTREQGTHRFHRLIAEFLS